MHRTPIQNRVEELWSLLNLVTNRGFNDKAFFIDYFADPIKRLIAKQASFEAIERGNQRTEELRTLLGKYLLQRKKEEVLADRLKGKREIVVFCELSELQKRIYLHLLSLPDFCNVKMGSVKCSCGSGRKRCCTCIILGSPLLIENLLGRIVA